jgi:hypothetical protein
MTPRALAAILAHFQSPLPGLAMNGQTTTDETSPFPMMPIPDEP